MNYIYCSDLKNYQVLGTFFEVLYNVKSVSNINPVPFVIVGERDADYLPALEMVLSERLGLENGLFLVNNETKFGDEIREKSVALSHEIGSVEELKAVEYNGINIGTGVASSLISKYRTVEPDFEEIRSEVKSYIYQSMLFLITFQEALIRRDISDDTIYIYNGRHYNTYPQSLVSEKARYDIRYYERMNGGRFIRIQKHRIHDFGATSHIVKELWNHSKEPRKKAIARSFFEYQKKNKFARKFAKNLDSCKPIVSFFSSSEDEYSSLDPRIRVSDLFHDQRMAIQWLIAWAESQTKFKLVIRLHPNQGNVALKDRSYWHSLGGANVVLIPSASQIDSYNLMMRSSKVVTFLSTVGIEATQCDIPSITLGNPIYKGLDAVYEPETVEELRELLDNNVKAKERDNALPFGYFNLRFGSKLKFFRHAGLASFEEYPAILVGKQR